MVNGIASLISLSVFSLLVHRNARDFCIFHLQGQTRPWWVGKTPPILSHVGCNQLCTWLETFKPELGQDLPITSTSWMLSPEKHSLLLPLIPQPYSSSWDTSLPGADLVPSLCYCPWESKEGKADLSLTLSRHVTFSESDGQNPTTQELITQESEMSEEKCGVLEERIRVAEKLSRMIVKM